MGAVCLGGGHRLRRCAGGRDCDALGVGLTANDSAAKIAGGLHEHHTRLLVITYLSAVYAIAFLIYLSSLYNLLREDTDRPRILGSLVLVGGVLFITCTPSATSGSRAWSARSSPHLGLNTIPASPTRCI